MINTDGNFLLHDTFKCVVSLYVDPSSPDGQVSITNEHQDNGYLFCLFCSTMIILHSSSQ